QSGLAAKDLIELLLELILVEQLAASDTIDLRAQFGDPVFVSELHLCLTRNQTGQHVVTKGEICGGSDRPHCHEHQRADPDPKRDRSETQLAAGMGQGVARTTFTLATSGRGHRLGGYVRPAVMLVLRSPCSVRHLTLPRRSRWPGPSSHARVNVGQTWLI